MPQGNLLEIYYDRIESTEEIILTPENCLSYGYLSTTKEIEGVSYTVYYKEGDSEENFIQPNLSTGLTTISYNTYKTYRHIAPACSSFRISYADVDKEGSGRNSLTGEMFRERIGNYCMVELTWDLIPNSEEYNRWYKILTHLPPNFYADLLMPSGEIETKKFYRADITTDLYLFLKDNQMWRGLSTSFTQWNVDEYDDTYEPVYEG